MPALLFRLQKFLRFGFQAPLHLLDVLRGRQLFRRDISFQEEISNVTIVLHMLLRDCGFGTQRFLLDIKISDFVGEVLRLDGDGWKEIRKRSIVWNFHATFHGLRCHAE